jgi:hydrogenase small subunit
MRKCVAGSFYEGGHMPEKTIAEELRRQGLSRRQFLKVSGMLAGAIGLLESPLHAMAHPANPILRALESRQRAPVIWLEFQDCAGCSEAITRSQAPTLVDLVLNTLTIEYHETLSAASGFQVEEAKQAAMKKYAGSYVLVVEGSIPTADGGVYCTIGGRTAVDLLQEAAAGAAAIIATGNCASFGGLPKADPNPTDARSVMALIKGKPIINIPGCPAIPEVTAGAIAQFVLFGMPKLDALGRPLAFYGNTIHDRCLRRPFYEEGKYASAFDDDGARQGWCLYKLGCKGPTTYNACASMKWGAGLSFPVQSGHPCLGCSEPDFWDGGGFYQGQPAPLSRPALAAIGAAAAAGAALGIGTALVNRSQQRPHAPTTASESTEGKEAG